MHIHIKRTHTHMHTCKPLHANTHTAQKIKTQKPKIHTYRSVGHNQNESVRSEERAQCTVPRVTNLKFVENRALSRFPGKKMQDQKKKQTKTILRIYLRME